MMSYNSIVYHQRFCKNFRARVCKAHQSRPKVHL